MSTVGRTSIKQFGWIFYFLLEPISSIFGNYLSNHDVYLSRIGSCGCRSHLLHLNPILSRSIYLGTIYNLCPASIFVQQQMVDILQDIPCPDLDARDYKRYSHIPLIPSLYIMPLYCSQVYQGITKKRQGARVLTTLAISPLVIYL